MTFSVGDLFLILPELLVITAACVVLVLDPVLRGPSKDGLVWLSLGTLVICIGLTASQVSGPTAIFSGLVIVDAYGAFWKLLLYFVTGLTILLSYSYLKEERLYFGEYYGFILLALAGMMVMVSADDLLTIYLGTELMSLSLYVLAGLKRAEPRSLEASAKYFVLGAFSSGILLYGISLLYGATGSTRLPEIATAIASQGLSDPLLLFSTILLAVGFGF
ncbi:MAG: proton-conducting transporter membrane subunit, partial [Nitrospira sp.]|nr:proton-conducting transporter membrane subunit [Nitrospira sp.]